MKKMIYVCSPCRPTAADPALRAIQKASNIALAKKAGKKIAKDCAIPIIPHLYFTQLLDDETPEEREIGMELGLDMLSISDELWVVTDDLISDGMMAEIEVAAILDIPIRMFDSEGTENKHIQELVEMIKEEHEADELDDFQDESEDCDEFGEDIDGDPCAGCDGCFEEASGDVENLINTVIDRIFNFLDSDKDRLTIRIEKPEAD